MKFTDFVLSTQGKIRLHHQYPHMKRKFKDYKTNKPWIMSLFKNYKIKFFDLPSPIPISHFGNLKSGRGHSIYKTNMASASASPPWERRSHLRKKLKDITLT